MMFGIFIFIKLLVFIVDNNRGVGKLYSYFVIFFVLELVNVIFLVFWMVGLFKICIVFFFFFLVVCLGFL